MGCSCPVLPTTIDLGLSTHGRHGKSSGVPAMPLMRQAVQPQSTATPRYSRQQARRAVHRSGWDNSQTSSTLDYATPEGRWSGISAVPPRLLPILLPSRWTAPTDVDNPGISAQPTIGDGRSWTTCPLLRNRRSLPGRDPTGMLGRQGATCLIGHGCSSTPCSVVHGGPIGHVGPA